VQSRPATRGRHRGGAGILRFSPGEKIHKFSAPASIAPPEGRLSAGWHRRGGLLWLDGFCTDRYANGYLACTPAQQKQVLDAIAFRRNAKKDPALSQGVAFFGPPPQFDLRRYYTSKIGIADLQYIGTPRSASSLAARRCLNSWRASSPISVVIRIGISHPEQVEFAFLARP